MSANKREVNSDNNKTDANDQITPTSGKTLVVYYSASGNTERIAKAVASAANKEMIYMQKNCFNRRFGFKVWFERMYMNALSVISLLDFK